MITSQSRLGEPRKQYTTSDEPNQLDIPVAYLATWMPGQAAERIAVFVGTEASGTTSLAGLSVAFDTLTGPKPLVDSISRVAPDKFAVKWHPSTVTDPNPGDPLDLPPAVPQYEILADRNDDNQYEVVAPKTTASTAIFTQLSEPTFRFSVQTFDEWGKQYSADQPVDIERWVRVSIPAAADYGRPTTITGTIERWTQSCDPHLCSADRKQEDPRPVVLQARANAASAWSATRSPPSRGHGVSGKFLDPSVKYGQKATHVTIAPPADVRATLQHWDGKAWRDVKWVQLTGGAGNYTFTATQPGRVTYRFLVPAFTYAGRPLSWQVSPNFVLTTSWSSGATVE